MKKFAKQSFRQQGLVHGFFLRQKRSRKRCFRLKTQKPGKDGEIQLTDALCKLAQDETVYAYRFKGRRYDIGDKQGFLEATVESILKRPELRRNFVQYLADMFGREASDRTVEEILTKMELARKQ